MGVYQDVSPFDSNLSIPVKRQVCKDFRYNHPAEFGYANRPEETAAWVWMSYPNFIANCAVAYQKSKRLSLSVTFLRPQLPDNIVWDREKTTLVMEWLEKIGVVTDHRKGFHVPGLAQNSSWWVTPKVLDLLVPVGGDDPVTDANYWITGVHKKVKQERKSSNKSTTKRNISITMHGRRKKHVEIPREFMRKENEMLARFSTAAMKAVNLNIGQFTMKFARTLNTGGRIYCSYQQLPKEQRASITINGEPTTELDYHANHLKMVLRLAGCEIPDGDLYDGLGAERNEAKRAVNIALNAHNPLKVLTDNRRHGLKWSGEKAMAFIERLVEKFPAVSDMLGTNIGIALQRLEGEICYALMLYGREHGFVVLPMHDGLIVPVSRTGEMKEVMSKTWDRIVSQYSLSGLIADALADKQAKFVDESDELEIE